MLPKGYRTVVDWFQEVASDPDYANPKFERIDVGEESDDDVGWGAAEDDTETETPKQLEAGVSGVLEAVVEEVDEDKA